jgi:hypothetical protein
MNETKDMIFTSFYVSLSKISENINCCDKEDADSRVPLRLSDQVSALGSRSRGWEKKE